MATPEFGDSFGYYATAHLARKYTAVGTGASISGSAGRNGAGLVLANNADAFVQLAVTSAGTKCIGVAIKAVDLNAGDRRICSFMEGSTDHLTFTVNNAGQIIASRGGTAILTTSSCLNTGTHTYIEIKVTIHDTTGSIEVRANPTPGAPNAVGTFSGDTRNAGTSGVVDLVVLGTRSSLGTALSCQMCDFHISDDFQGDVSFARLLPTGAGAAATWTPSAGSNYQNVDETSTDDDTTYNEDSTPGNIDSHAMENLTPAAATVIAVLVNNVAKKTDAGPRTTRNKVRLSGTYSNGTNRNLTTSYMNYQDVFTTKPGGGSWSVTDVNNVEAGYETIA